MNRKSLFSLCWSCKRQLIRLLFGDKKNLADSLNPLGSLLLIHPSTFFFLGYMVPFKGDAIVKDPLFLLVFLFAVCVCAFIVFIGRQHRHGNALFQLVHSNQLLLLLLLPCWPYLSFKGDRRKGGVVWKLSAPPLTFYPSIQPSVSRSIHSFPSSLLPIFSLVD